MSESPVTKEERQLQSAVQEIARNGFCVLIGCDPRGQYVTASAATETNGVYRIVVRETGEDALEAVFALLIRVTRYGERQP